MTLYLWLYEEFFFGFQEEGDINGRQETSRLNASANFALHICVYCRVSLMVSLMCCWGPFLRAVLKKTEFLALLSLDTSFAI